jgi:hypothetical protein|nr:MAG TPA: hypothetical protein [Caudoviricetes sp.]
MTAKKKKSALKTPGRKRIKRKFEETRVGHFLKYEAPVEYLLIMNAMKFMRNQSPPAELIESVSYGSCNPLFKKCKFRNALIEYRKHGLHSGNPMLTSTNTEIYYSKIRKNNKIPSVKNTFLEVQF